MQESDKTDGRAPDRKEPAEPESIVMSTMDESMPASLAVDEDGLLDIDKLNAQKIEAVKQAAKDQQIQSLREEAGLRAKPSAERSRVNPVRALLRILRKPEHLLIGWYYKSNLRSKLRRKYRWYKEYEGAHEMSGALRNAYGSSNHLLSSTAQFIRNNILVTLCLTALFGHLFVDYLSESTRSQGTAQVSSTHASAAPAAGAAGANEVDLARNLNHCAVSGNLRRVYNSQQNKALRKNVLYAISDFVKVYTDSDLENWYLERAAKRDLTLAHIQAALPRIQSYSAHIFGEITELARQRADLEQRLQGIDVTSKHGINDFIRARAELVRLDEQLRYGSPIEKILSILDEQMLRLKNLSHGEPPLSDDGPSRWAVATGEKDLDSFTDIVSGVIAEDVDANIVDPALDSPGAKLYRLQILAATIRDFADLITHLSEFSNHNVIKITESQNTNNDRLRDLLGFQGHPEVVLLNYDNCLSVIRVAGAKLTVL